MERWRRKRDALLQEIERLKTARRVAVICCHCGQVIHVKKALCAFCQRMKELSN